MKKITSIFSYLLLATVILFTACNPNEEIYDELDEVDTGLQKEIEVTLTSTDYQNIADLAYEDATTPEDSSKAAFIESNQYFNDDIPAADYVPYYLEDTYGAYGLNSSAEVTFDYNTQLPEEFEQYTTAEEYELEDADYILAGPQVGAAQYFFPDKPAEQLLPDVLAETVSDAAENDIVLVSYEQSDVNFDTASSQGGVIYEEDFFPEEDNLGSFTAYNVSGEQDWFWQSYGEGCATMNGYDGSDQENQNLLVSSEISLEDVEEVKMNFSQAVNYMDEGFWDQLQVVITDDYNPDSPIDSPWDELTVPNWPPGNNWDFYPSGNIDLSSYIGSTVRIAFFYTSSTENACTWEVGDVQVLSAEEPDTQTIETFYQFDGAEWATIDDVYYLNAHDYDEMGSPGQYDNFSGSDLPKDYLLNFVEAKYPLAQNEVSKTIVYKFYNGSNTIKLASTFTAENGEWTSSFNYIDQTTQRFLVAEKRGKWIFDPTVRFEMVSTDYQYVVDAVQAEYGSEFVDDFGTGEFYTGANSYYNNFDIRISERLDYEPETFEGLSDEEANNLIHQRLVLAMQLLLENKYPEAVPQVSGVDVHYIVTFESYNNDFSRSTWVADMVCVSAGNPPEFELVDNTFMRDGEPVVVPE